jgi:TolB-like protein/Flp pilus assembly protein TadD
MSFIEELKRRNVVRVGIAYIIASWLLLQLTEVLIELLDIPDVAGRIVVLLLIVGFVPAIIFAWAFEMTPEGIKREKDVDRSQSVTNQTGRKLDFTIIGVLAIGILYLLVDKFVFDDSVETSAEIAATETPVSVSPVAIQEPAPPADLSNSIAVLPFANRSNKEDDMFFTDGIHDDLLTQLAKIRDLKVISRTSVMKYKNTEKTIPEIAAELQVTTILEGGIQRAGKRIRINAQLIDVATDQHLWAETFDREMTVENIFEIQSEIARHIVTAVRGEMTEEEQLNLSRVPTTNLLAYESYLQALALTNRADYSQENYIEAEIWAKKAVEFDPEFSQAWAMLVEIHAQATWIGYDLSPERFAMAKTALDNAIRFGPDLPETTAAKAEYQYRIEHNFRQSVETFKEAYRALPGDADILHRLGVAQRRTGDLEGAVQSFELSLELDPGFSRSPTTMIETLIFYNQFARASKLLDDWMIRYPDAKDLRAGKVQTYMYQGDLKSARALLDTMNPWVSFTFQQTITQLPMFERDYEKYIEVTRIPEVLAVSENRGPGGDHGIGLAWAYKLMGDHKQAEKYIDQSIDYYHSLTPTGTDADGRELSKLAVAYALKGENEKAREAARKSREIIPEGENGDIFSSAGMSRTNALVLGMTGKRDEALLEIERLLEHPTGFTRWELYLDPRWDFFRDDERFNALARPENLQEGEE